MCYQAHRFVSKEVNDEQDVFLKLLWVEPEVLWLFYRLLVTMFCQSVTFM